MLQAAKSAPNLLREAGDRVVEFLHGCFNPDGGARGRSDQSDLYYTVFALEGLAAMRAEPPFEAVLGYLHSFDGGADLDFVHRACLARCWAAMPPGSLDARTADRIRQGLEAHRSNDGGYGAMPGASYGTVYHCFLALGAYQDLGRELPDPDGVCHCLDGLRTSDGAYANERALELGTTPATAAAVTIFRNLGRPVPPVAGDWLAARRHHGGGFLAMPRAPFPDWLSTATAVHALAQLGTPLETLRRPCLDFVDSLWTGRAFTGHQADKTEDCEYTYYALLTMGHLGA
jgi:hypothetical protein